MRRSDEGSAARAAAGPTGLLRRRVWQGAAGLAMGLAGGWAAKAAPPARPDILFILADDLGYADLGCYGRRGLKTPNIDRLAAEGVRLTQAYANSAVCSASRTAIITGRYQDRLAVGLPEPLGGDPKEWPNLPADRPTLPSYLKAAGYRTALIGKWHLAGGTDGPHKAGYDYFYGFHPGATDYFRRLTETEAEAKDAQGAALYENSAVIRPEGYLTDLLAAAAVRQIAEAPSGQSLFLSLHFNAPHWPWEGPGDQKKSAALKKLRDSDSGNEATFGAMVERMDQGVGLVLAALERAGRANNTIVIFTSDNGGERFSDTWPLTGMKGELLEGGIRVPALVRWPGRIAAGSTSDQVAIGMDWLPTLIAAAGLRPVGSYAPDGENLMPVLSGAAPPHPRTLYWRYKAFEQAAMREGDWKYLIINGQEHLFNLAEDERERADRKEADTPRLKRMRNAWDAWNAGMLPFPIAMPSDTPKGHLADHY